MKDKNWLLMDTFCPLVTGISMTSFLAFQCLFYSVSPWLSARISVGFPMLNRKQKIEWNSRTVSTLHAVVMGLFCLYILFFDDAINKDPIWGDPALVKISVGITTGYLISDLLLIRCYWTAIGEKSYVVHHLASLYACYYVLGQGMLPYFANFRLIAEISTPCVNQRWFFEVLGYPKSSKANIANGVLMAVTFFLVRIAIIPIYYGRMYSVYGSESFFRLPWGGRAAWIFSSICLDIMNVVWMHKIARGCYKVLLSSRRKKTELQENGKPD
ncbi:TLC domain-containing protein 4-B-like [Brienomyrus brachyistius]|uniref:TLC domain-containing protein 4-B-like n=1 Tax=Brienomyrus brachyistius TaxID=42636 RepID=UPI0020B225A4|nr:TLC domain-containing protein 4-B-like [Brienomyrus brachyistius]